MNNSKNTTSVLVRKVWTYAHVLKDDGLAFMDYTEQITYLLFLKMASEANREDANRIPDHYRWHAFRRIDNNVVLLQRYHQGLRELSEKPGLIGLIFTKPQSKINDPAKLRLLMQMIDSEDWSTLDVDIKGAVYEGLLARNADDVRGGAGQYFTPRPVVRAIVDVMRPETTMRIVDPACGTGGFLLAAFEYLKNRTRTEEETTYLRTRALHGVDIVPNVARLCAMNLFLHGIGDDHAHAVISIGDSLAVPSNPVDMVLTNPPFGKRSSVTVVGKGGLRHADKIAYERPDFWATTSNKQLNFLQHVYSMLRIGGRAAIVVPDNVLFEGGAGEQIRRSLLRQCDVHTLLRLPTGIWYSAGVKANVLFFDKVVPEREAATRETWIYDLRSGRKYSIRRNPIREEDLVDFVRCYHAEDRSKREETDRFRRFEYSEIAARERASLDIQWQSDEGDTEESDNPQAVMKQILWDLEEALREFSHAEDELRK